MATKGQRKDIIGFILTAERDLGLADEFLRIRRADGLYKFFQEKGFTEILEKDCMDIIRAREGLEGQYIPKAEQGNPCPPNVKY